MSEAPTPEEIAEGIVNEINGCISVTLGGHGEVDCIAQALRAYGDRRYCEARDAAADVATIHNRQFEDRVPFQLRIAEAIRKLQP